MPSRGENVAYYYPQRGDGCGLTQSDGYGCVSFAFFVNGPDSRPIKPPFLDRAQVEGVRSRGQRVTAAIIDSQQEGCGWEHCDLLGEFVPALVELIRTWGFDGVQLDCDGEHFAAAYQAMVPTLRDELGPDAILSLTIGLDECGEKGVKFLRAVAPYLNTISVMPYNNCVEDIMADVLELVQELGAVDFSRGRIFSVASCVKSASIYLEPEEAKELARSLWAEKLGGVMLWSCDADDPRHSSHPPGTYRRAIDRTAFGDVDNFVTAASAPGEGVVYTECRVI